MTKIISQDAQDFRELCELTERICNYMPKSLPKRYGKDKWVRLRTLWFNCCWKLQSEDVLSDALRYSVNPGAFRKYTNDQKLLLQKVADLIYNGSQAYQSWKESKIREDLFSTPPINALFFSAEYNSYLSAYYKILVKCRSTQIGASFIPEVSEDDYTAVHNFTEIIKRLVPSSTSWNSSQWLDLKLLLRELKRLYGIDFLKKCSGNANGNNFNHLLIIAVNSLYGIESPSGIYLGDALNLPVARVLWGNHAEKILLEHYCRSIDTVKRNAYDTLSQEVLLPCAEYLFRHSWMNAYVKEWYSDETSPYHHDAKKIIFEFRLCLPEYMPKEFDF